MEILFIKKISYAVFVISYPSTSAARSLSEYSGGKFFMYKFVSLRACDWAWLDDDEKPFTYGVLCCSYPPACDCADALKRKRKITYIYIK